MIKAKQPFFRTSNLNAYDLHGNKTIILYLASAHLLFSVLSAKLSFKSVSEQTQNKNISWKGAKQCKAP